ncbi:MAG: hypothetical protein WBG41_06020 [Acidimicrobiales bacterium]
MRDGSTSEQMGWSPRFGLVVVVTVVVVVVAAGARVELVADEAEGPLEHPVRQMAPATTAATGVSFRYRALRPDTLGTCNLPLVRVIVLRAGPDGVQLAMAPTT